MHGFHMVNYVAYAIVIVLCCTNGIFYGRQAVENHTESHLKVYGV